MSPLSKHECNIHVDWYPTTAYKMLLSSCLHEAPGKFDLLMKAEVWTDLANILWLSYHPRKQIENYLGLCLNISLFNPNSAWTVWKLPMRNHSLPVWKMNVPCTHNGMPANLARTQGFLGVGGGMAPSGITAVADLAAVKVQACQCYNGVTTPCF